MQEIITRNVIFHEEIFPFTHLSPSTFPSASHNNTSPPESSSASENVTINTSNKTSATDQNNQVTRAGRLTKLPSHLTDYLCNSVSSSSSYPISSYFSLSKLSPTHLKYIVLMTAVFEPKSYSQASSSPDWQQAMHEELTALEKTNTWKIMPLSPGKIPNDCKWVYKVKFRADATVERLKARLVAKGFTQLEGVDFLDTFSPVAKLTTVKFMLALAAIKGWTLSHLDINNAFLYGDLSEEIYMNLPPGLIVEGGSSSGPKLVCKLNKSLYGLKQASRQWYLKLSEVLAKFGLQQSASDHSFYKSDSSTFFGAVVYVDDILIATSRLSQYVSKPCDEHWEASEKILRYLKGTPGHGLFYSSDNKPALSIFSDADWAACLDTRRSMICSLALHWCLGRQRNSTPYLDRQLRQNTGPWHKRHVKWAGLKLYWETLALQWRRLYHCSVIIKQRFTLALTPCFMSVRSILKLTVTLSGKDT